MKPVLPKGIEMLTTQVILICLISSLIKATRSPDEPCMCYQTKEACGCMCSQPVSEEYFKKMGENFAPCEIFSLFLLGGKYYSFPANYFSKLGAVKQFNLDLNDVTFEYFLDPANGTSPFKGVSFEFPSQISLRNIKVNKEWNWGAMEELKSTGGDLSIRIYDSTIPELTSDFSKIAGGHVEVVRISGSLTEKVGDKAFAGFSKVNNIIFVENLFTEIKRSQFPRPAEALEELALAGNKLESLPTDLFTDMPALKHVFLGGNPIRTLEEDTFKPIKNATVVWGIEELPLHCDCKLKWLKDPTKTPEFLQKAICNSPPHLQGKLIFTEVSVNQLVC